MEKMGKVTRYLVILVVVCATVVSFWVYLRYVRQADVNLLTFTVERGAVEEIVRARGKVVTQKEYELGFSMGGTIKKVFVKEGQEVTAGTPLIELDKRNAELERNRISAILAQKQAALSQALAGTRTEELKVYQTKLTTAENTLTDAKKKLEEANKKTGTDLQSIEDTFTSAKLSLQKAKSKAEADIASYYGDAPGVLKAAFIKADDAVTQETEALFTNDSTANPKITFSVNGTSYVDAAQIGRVTAGNTLSAFSVDISDVDNASSYEIERLLVTSKAHLETIGSFLDVLSVALNKSINADNTVLAGYKTSVNTGRTNINTSITNINNLQQNITIQKAANSVTVNAAEASYLDAKNGLDSQGNTNESAITVAQSAVTSAENALKLAQDELALRVSGNRAEEITSARASVQESQNQLAAANETLLKSTITAPSDGIVSKINLEEHEVATAGQMVLTFSTEGQKVEADITELDIGKIKEDGTQTVDLMFDSYPDNILKGRVLFVNQQEIIQEGDTYYRVNIILEEQDGVVVRSGMSADALIMISKLENVLNIPSILVKKDNGKTFVTKLDDNKKQEEVEVLTGATNGEVIEIISGLEEGQTIILKSD
jgi:RND family efflux transporter MFP subunit